MQTHAAAPSGLHSRHPLEIFPFFRQFRPGTARDLLYTAIWNCALGFVFWVLAIFFGGGANATGVSLGWNVIVANVIGYTLHGLFVIGGRLGIERRARAAGSLAVAAYYTAIPTGGVVGGFALVTAFLGEQQFVNFLRDPRWIGVMAGSSLMISAILAAIFFARERQARVEAALERERTRAERVEREAALATLRALQAQIEPHFLFNTLANVASLIDSDPALSKRMLERFIRFLRASLAATREETTTLADEGDLIDAYLDVMEVRMASRMRHQVSVEPAIAAMRVPPMLLQPLVENAIRHGLEPRIGIGLGLVLARVAQRDDLLGVRVPRAERVRERRGTESPALQRRAVVAYLVHGLVRRQRLDVRVVDRVAADLVAERGQSGQLLDGHVIGVTGGDRPAVDEERGVHPVVP